MSYVDEHTQMRAHMSSAGYLILLTNYFCDVHDR